MTINSNQGLRCHPLDIYGDIKQIARIYYWSTAAILLALIAAIIIVLSTNNTLSATLIGLSLIPVLTTFLFIHYNKFEWASIFLAVVLFSLITLLGTIGLGIHHISNLGFPAVLIIASLVTRKRTLIFLTLYTIGCIAWLVFGEIWRVYTPTVLIKSVPGDFFSASIAIVITAFISRLLTETFFQNSQRLQRELKERNIAEEKYRNIFENAIVGIFQSTPEGRLVSVNPAMARMYGYESPQEMVESVTDIASQIYIDPSLRDVLRMHLEAGEKIIEYESQEYRKDKSKLWTAMNAQAIRDENSRILFYEGTVEDITLAKEADTKRKEAETLYRTLVEQTSIVVYRDAPDSTASSLYISPQIKNLLGYTVEEWLKDPSFWKTRVHPQDWPKVDEYIMEHYVSKKDNSSMEYRMQTKAGDWRWVRDETVIVQDEEGNAQFIHGVFLDITERKQAENSLLQFRKVMDESNDALYLIDPETSRYIDFNRSAYESLGYSREELIQLGVIDIAEHVTSMDVWRQRVILVSEKGGLIFEANYRRKDGTKFPTEVSARMLEYDGEMIMVANVRDITLRKQAELEREQLISELAVKNAESETLRESFAAIAGTFEFSEIIEYILDQIGRVVPFDSASVWRLEGNAQKLIASRNLPADNPITEMEIKVDEINSAFPILNGDVPYILNHNVQEELLDFKDPPHNIINSWLAIPLKTRGKIIGLIALDGYQHDQFNQHHAQLAVTFANQVAIALENSSLFTELQNELFTSEKLVNELESKNTELERFTYTISHDLKSPLVTINGFLGYLKGDAALGNPERVAIDIQRIQDAVDKMHLLLKELLELSRIGRIINPPEKVSFDELVSEALQIVHGQLEARGVTVKTQPDLPAIQGDRQRLIEVLQNLVDNAIKYMGNQSKPLIEIGQRGEDAELNQLVFFVKDNGIGIDKKYHELVFGLFNKLDPKSEGTGVGLALIKRIIEVQGGRIWIESAAGKGTTFFFTIPRSN